MLKKLLAISFFIIIAARPAYTISYLLYFQFNIDVIVQKYCVNKDKPQMHCNGKCYLVKQLNIDNEKASETNRTVVSFLEAFIPLYYHSNDSSWPKPLKVFHLLANSNISHFETTDYIFKIYHPPKIIIS